MEKGAKKLLKQLVQGLVKDVGTDVSKKRLAVCFDTIVKNLPPGTSITEGLHKHQNLYLKFFIKTFRKECSKRILVSLEDGESSLASTSFLGRLPSHYPQDVSHSAQAQYLVQKLQQGHNLKQLASFVKEFEVSSKQLCPGVEKFSRLLALTSGSRDITVLKKIMQLYFNALQEETEQIVAKRIQARAKEEEQALHRFLQLCHLRRSMCDEDTGKPPYPDLLASLLSLYLDLFLVSHGREAVEKKAQRQVCCFVRRLMAGSDSQMFDVLLQVTAADQTNASWLLLLLRKVLKERPQKKSSDLYLRFLLTVRMWSCLLDLENIPAEAHLMRAPKGFSDWLLERNPALSTELPSDRKFKGRVVTRFVLDEMDQGVQDMLLDALIEKEKDHDTLVDVLQVSKGEAGGEVSADATQDGKGKKTKKKKRGTKKRKEVDGTQRDGKDLFVLDRKGNGHTPVDTNEDMERKPKKKKRKMEDAEPTETGNIEVFDLTSLLNIGSDDQQAVFTIDRQGNQAENGGLQSSGKTKKKRKMENSARKPVKEGPPSAFFIDRNGDKVGNDSVTSETEEKRKEDEDDSTAVELERKKKKKNKQKKLASPDSTTSASQVMGKEFKEGKVEAPSTSQEEDDGKRSARQKAGTAKEEADLFVIDRGDKKKKKKDKQVVSSTADTEQVDWFVIDRGDTTKKKDTKVSSDPDAKVANLFVIDRGDKKMKEDAVVVSFSPDAEDAVASSASGLKETTLGSLEPEKTCAVSSHGADRGRRTEESVSSRTENTDQQTSRAVKKPRQMEDVITAELGTSLSDEEKETTTSPGSRDKQSQSPFARSSNKSTAVGTISSVEKSSSPLATSKSGSQTADDETLARTRKRTESEKISPQRMTDIVTRKRTESKKTPQEVTGMITRRRTESPEKGPGVMTRQRTESEQSSPQKAATESGVVTRRRTVSEQEPKSPAISRLKSPKMKKSGGTETVEDDFEIVSDGVSETDIKSSGKNCQSPSKQGASPCGTGAHTSQSMFSQQESGEDTSRTVDWLVKRLASPQKSASLTTVSDSEDEGQVHTTVPDLRVHWKTVPTPHDGRPNTSSDTKSTRQKRKLSAMSSSSQGDMDSMTDGDSLFSPVYEPKDRRNLGAGDDSEKQEHDTKVSPAKKSRSSSPVKVATADRAPVDSSFAEIKKRTSKNTPPVAARTRARRQDAQTVSKKMPSQPAGEQEKKSRKTSGKEDESDSEVDFPKMSSENKKSDSAIADTNSDSPNMKKRKSGTSSSQKASALSRVSKAADRRRSAVTTRVRQRTDSQSRKELSRRKSIGTVLSQEEQTPQKSRPKQQSGSPQVQSSPKAAGTPQKKSAKSGDNSDGSPSAVTHEIETRSKSPKKGYYLRRRLTDSVKKE